MNICFAERLGQTEYDSIVEQIIICNALHNRWLLLHHVIDGYDEATKKAVSDYDIHRNQMKCYYILKALRHCLDSDPPTVYNTPDKLYCKGCCRATVKDTKANGKYEANKADTVMG